MKSISKTELIECIKAWGQGEMSDDSLQEWMIDRYDPTEVEIGPSEPENVVEAMNVVMNEYEIAATDKFVRANYGLAIAFIESDPHNFLDRRTVFLRKGFID